VRGLISLIFLFTYWALLGQVNPKSNYIKDYYRKDGTHVQGHYRTEKNNTNTDNYSTKGNVNPYTGKPGWITPDGGTPNTNDYPETTIDIGNQNSQKEYSNVNSDGERYEGKFNSKGKKVITNSNGQEVFGLCKTCSDVIYKNDLEYHWYTPYSGIQKTKGASGGNLLDGEYLFYSESGNLVVKRAYKRGLDNGDCIVWDKSGNIKEKLHFINGVANYYWFINEEGYIVEWKGEMFKKGSLKLIRSSAGQLLEKSEVLEDWTFKVTTYYSSGMVKSLFTEGVVDDRYGDSFEYYEDGKIKFHGIFSDKGFRTGEWKWYNKDGTVESKEKYKYSCEKYEDGTTIKEEGSLMYDEISKTWIKGGKWREYDSYGNFKADVEYVMGELKTLNE
jgi:antitoxin component YwqK of YwqJK toxin-antitoxin module